MVKIDSWSIYWNQMISLCMQMRTFTPIGIFHLFQKVFGLNDKSQNLMKISFKCDYYISIGVQGIYKWLMWLNCDLNFD